MFSQHPLRRTVKPVPCLGDLSARQHSMVERMEEGHQQAGMTASAENAARVECCEQTPQDGVAQC